MLVKLEEGVLCLKNEETDHLRNYGLIQYFEYSVDLFSKTVSGFASWQGNDEVKGSRDAVRYAYANQLIEDGHLWMDITDDRQRTVHAYDEAILKSVKESIMELYLPVFQNFREVMQKLDKPDGLWCSWPLIQV